MIQKKTKNKENLLTFYNKLINKNIFVNTQD